MWPVLYCVQIPPSTDRPVSESIQKTTINQWIPRKDQSSSAAGAAPAHPHETLFCVDDRYLNTMYHSIHCAQACHPSFRKAVRRSESSDPNPCGVPKSVRITIRIRDLLELELLWGCASISKSRELTIHLPIAFWWIETHHTFLSPSNQIDARSVLRADGHQPKNVVFLTLKVRSVKYFLLKTKHTLKLMNPYHSSTNVMHLQYFWF